MASIKNIETELYKLFTLKNNIDRLCQEIIKDPDRLALLKERWNKIRPTVLELIISIQSLTFTSKNAQYKLCLPLFYACHIQDTEIFQAMINLSFDSSIFSQEHHALLHQTNSPIFIIAERGSPSDKIMLEIILTHKGLTAPIKNELLNLQSLEHDNNTPILYSIYRQNYDVSTILIKNGADPNLSSFYGETPLSAVLQHSIKLADVPERLTNIKPHTAVDIISLLINSGASYSYINPWSQKKVFNIINDIKCVKTSDKLKMLVNAIILDSIKNNSYTPTKIGGKSSVIEDEKYTDDYFDNKELAIESPYEDLISMLNGDCSNSLSLFKDILDEKIDLAFRHDEASGLIPFVNKKGQTPLHIAIKHGLIESSFLLVRMGALSDIVDTSKKNPLELITSRTMHLAVYQALIKTRADAATRSFDESIIMLIKAFEEHQKIRISHPTIFNIEPTLIISDEQKLLQATISGDFEELDELINSLSSEEYWYNVNHVQYKETESSLLHIAISQNNIPIAILLIECGASCDAEDRFKRTPIYYISSFEMFVAIDSALGANDLPDLCEHYHSYLPKRSSTSTYERKPVYIFSRGLNATMEFSKGSLFHKKPERKLSSSASL